MKKTFRLLGIITLAVIIGFGMMACGGGDGSDKYSGKDVMGNTYSLSVGSDARAAAKGDRYSMEVKTKDGKTKTSKGAVTSVSADGTLTLQPDGTGAAFVAVENAGTITSVADAAGGFGEITYDDGTKFAPRTFENIYLRATRWTNDEEGSSGEHYGSGLSILVKDFPTLVTQFKATNPENYLVKICGISDKAIDHLNIEVQGIKSDDTWFYIGGYNQNDKSIKANENFYITVPLTTIKACNFSDFKEVLVQITDIKNYKEDDTAVVDFGSIPNSIPDGEIVTTISKFGVGLFDASAVTGNMGFYEFGIAEDGVSPNYNNAQWDFGYDEKDILGDAQKSGAKFVLEMTVKPTKKLLFAWSNPIKQEWWHETEIFDGTNFKNGAEWDEGTKKLAITVETAIKAGTGKDKYSEFTSINVENEGEYTQFILYYGNTDERDGILVLGIKSANIE